MMAGKLSRWIAGHRRPLHKTECDPAAAHDALDQAVRNAETASALATVRAKLAVAEFERRRKRK